MNQIMCRRLGSCTINTTMALTPTQLDAALNMLTEDFHTTPCELFLSLIRSTMHHQHSAFIEVIHRSPAILAAMEGHPRLSDLYLNTAKGLITRQCKNEVVKLSSKSNEFHFAANSMTEEQIRAYQVSDAIEKVSTQAPILWGLLLSLLSSDDDINDRRRYLNQRSTVFVEHPSQLRPPWYYRRRQ